MIVDVVLPVVYGPPELDRINFLHTHYVILAERVYNVVARGSQTEFNFALVIIRSCLATSHKQILKTPCGMTSSCILGFQATRPPTIGWQINRKGSLYTG